MCISEGIDGELDALLGADTDFHGSECYEFF